MKTPFYCFCFLFLLLCLPSIQTLIDWPEQSKLKGDVRITKTPEFSTATFWDGNYQTSLNNAQRDQMGLFPFFVRLRNQIDWTLFKKPHAKNVVIGQQNYLFSRPYLNTRRGDDFLGTEFLRQRINKYQALSDSMAKRGQKLVIAIAPSKAQYYEEFLPEDQLSSASDSTNYLAYREILKKHTIPFVDFNAWFLQIKDTVSCPIMTRDGIHWSDYGMKIASDSLTRLFENLLVADLPDAKVTKLLHDYKSRGVDRDLLDAMNLLYPWPQEENCGLGLSWNDPANQKKYKPNILVVADSFYSMISGKNWRRANFSLSDFWYYNRRFYGYPSKENTMGKTVDHTAVAEYIKRYDIILLLGAPPNLADFDWGFTGDALRKKD